MAGWRALCLNSAPWLARPKGWDSVPSISIAEELAKKQREISVSEFFERNKQILGYDSPTRALLTAVKEAVDNGLDAAGDADILPEIGVEIRRTEKDEYVVVIEDNGPGIVKREVANVFGRLLYGSRFHTLAQSLHPDEPVCVIRNGRFELLPIGTLGDRIFEEGEEGSLPLSDDMLAPCFSRRTGKIRWASVTHVIRHKSSHDMVKVGLSRGNQIRVTANHSLFSYSPERGVHEIEAGGLRPGDFVLVPRRLPEVPEALRVRTLNLFEHIPQGLVRRHRWYVYGVPDRVIKEIESSPKTRFRIGGRSKKAQYHYVYRNVAIPVENFRASYRTGRFLPLWFVLSAGLGPELRGARLRTYQSGTGKPQDLPFDVELTEDLAWFLGLYGAEGHAGARQFALTLGLHERGVADRALQVLRDVFGLQGRVRVRRNSLRVCGFSNVLAVVLPRWCGSGAFYKRVPEFIFRASSRVRRAFLEGIYLGDGSVAHPQNQLDYSTVSPRLANELAYLWRLEGAVASVKEAAGGTLGRHPRRSYRVQIFGGDIGLLPTFPIKRPTRQNRYRSLPAAILGPFAVPGRKHVEMSKAGLVAAVVGSKPPFSDAYLAQLEGAAPPKRHSLLGFRLRERGLTEGTGRLTPLGAQVLQLASSVDWFASTDLALARVESIEMEESSPWVYDLSVPGDGEDENFIAGSRGPICVKNSRGQQGLGISGAIMYGQITTGKPATIRTKTAEMDVAYEVDLIVDTRRNKPSVQREEFKVWDKPHGTRVEIPLKARYITGKQSVYEYLKSTAIVNPHARIIFQPPEGEASGFERGTNELPSKTVPIKPHPYGIQIGTLLGMAKETKSYKLSAFLEEEFSRISPRVSKEICEVAGVAADMRPKTLSLEQAKAIVDAIPKVKVMAPPTDCLSPIGERLIKRGLKNVLGSVRPEFYSPPVSRDPGVWQGNPFQVEVGIVFGGDLPADQPVEILRFANRVPLLYQGGACATVQAAQAVDWRRYGLEQRGGEGIPYGAAIILVHVCSTKIPYTNEAKEAIAPMPEILEELDLALKESGRRLNTHLEKKARRVKTSEKFEIVQKVLPLIAKKSASVVNKKIPNLDATVTKIMGVVWIEEAVTFKDGTHTVTIDVHNFTPTGKKLNLHALLPGKEGKLGKVTPKPADIREDGKITWELKRIGSVEKETVTFEVTGLDKGEYDETDLYVSGISPDLVIGAEPLPGDWELNYKEFEAEEEAPPPEEEEGEVDYDEAEEKLGDE